MNSEWGGMAGGVLEAMDGARGRVAQALEWAGLEPVGSNHAMRAGDGSPEGRVDMVFASRGHTFAIEIVGRQGAGRRAGRDFWESRARCRALSASLGLPESNGVHLVRVDPERREGGWPRASGPAVLLGRNHVEQLGRMEPEGARRLFLEWNRL